MEDLVDELFKAYEKSKTSTDMFKLINHMKEFIDDDVVNDLHNIRIIRNKAAHKKETSYAGTSGESVDTAEAIIALKKLYDILGWFINLYQEPILQFMPFQEVIVDILDKSLERPQLPTDTNAQQSAELDISIGQFIQSTVIDLLERNHFSDEEIDLYTMNEYSMKTFGLVLPFLSTVRSGRIKGRYYSKPAKINGKRYYICNGWNDNNKPKLFEWLKKKQEEFGIKVDEK